MKADSPAATRFSLAADAVTMASLAWALVLVVAGPFRAVVAGEPFAIVWLHPAYAAVAAAAIRHAAQPRPTLAESVRRWVDAVRMRPALADAVLVFWMTRPTVLLIGLMAVVSIGPPTAAQQATPSGSPVGSLASRWDAMWYAGIALEGYEWHFSFDRQQNVAFFPAYPLVIRATATVAGALRPGVPRGRQIDSLTWCGAMISLVAFFWAAWYFARLARELLDGERARHALTLLAAYPFALFYSAAYTESLSLLTTLATWYHFRHGEMIRAGAWGLVAGLTRPNGCFISIPLALIALGMKDAGRREDASPAARHRMGRLIVAAMPGVGMLLFTVYIFKLTNIWFAWSRIQVAWGRSLGMDATSSWLDSIGTGGLLDIVMSNPYDALNALALLFVLMLIRAVWKHVGAVWALFVLANVLAPVLTGGLLSLGRMTSTLFPLFLALAVVLPPRVTVAVAAASGALQGLAAVLFFTWRDLY